MELRNLPDGTPVRIAGSVIARQRPGTAKGFVFLSLEDETGIANAIITPQLFERDHVVIVHQQFLVIEGKLQNQENVISVKAESIRPLYITQRRNHFARFSLTSFALARIVYAQIMHAAANGYDGAHNLGHPPRVPHPGMTAIHHAMAHEIDNRRGHLNRDVHRGVPGKRP